MQLQSNIHPLRSGPPQVTRAFAVGLSPSAVQFTAIPETTPEFGNWVSPKGDLTGTVSGFSPTIYPNLVINSSQWWSINEACSGVSRSRHTPTEPLRTWRPASDTSRSSGGLP